MSIKTVEAIPGLTMTATAPVRHLCPFVNEKDEGTVTVTWQTIGRTFELHSLRAHLDWITSKWADAEISHEDFTSEIRDSFAHFNGAGLHIKSIRTDWNTAGMPVTVST